MKQGLRLWRSNAGCQWTCAGHCLKLSTERACGSRQSGHCWELLALSLWFVSSRFVQCCCIPNKSCLTTRFLCFQTVAEIVKELEKNEKIRVQLELNKSGENVSWLSLFLNWGTGETAVWALSVSACHFVMATARTLGCMLDLACTIL